MGSKGLSCLPSACQIEDLRLFLSPNTHARTYKCTRSHIHTHETDFRDMILENSHTRYAKLVIDFISLIKGKATPICTSFSNTKMLS